MKVIVKKKERDIVMNDISKIEYSWVNEAIVIYDQENYVVGCYADLDEIEITIVEVN